MKRTKYIGKNRFFLPEEARVYSKPQAAWADEIIGAHRSTQSCAEMIDAAGHDHTNSVGVVGGRLNTGY
jgi:hypothetical protein